VIDFEPSLLGAYFTYVERTPVLPVTTSTEVIPADPNRVLLAFTASGAGVVVRPLKAATSNAGIALPNGGPSTVLTYSDWGTVLGNLWNAFSGAGGPFYVLSISFRPPVDGEPCAWKMSKSDAEQLAISSIRH
jgi:hypothetical protein